MTFFEVGPFLDKSRIVSLQNAQIRCATGSQAGRSIRTLIILRSLRSNIFFLQARTRRVVARAGRGSGESGTFIDVEASFLMGKNGVL